MIPQINLNLIDVFCQLCCIKIMTITHRLDLPRWKIRHIGIIKIGDDKTVQPIELRLWRQKWQYFFSNLVNKCENMANGKTDLFL